MSLIPPEIIEQVIAANDVVDVIGGYFPLKRSGPVYKAICPFHNEKTPSFTVNPQRQIFKCFGCGAGGNVLRFVMNYENLDFLGAVKKLAERAGIKIEQTELSAEQAAEYSMLRRLLALHAEAADFFHWHLMKKPSAQIARDYLKSRGIGADVARAWKLGYAPDEWDAMRDFADSRGFSDEELVASGLVKLRDEENPRSEFYDRFRARVMFPICKDTDEVIAFSGRVLQADAKAAKYVNSPETMLFKKGAVLFGLNKSKRALIEAKSAIVCEGQLDLITAFEHGVQNVIAPQGTAFTEKQAHILKRFVEEVVLCFDADVAGEKAAERSLASLLAENLLVRVAGMPQGEDPDSMIRGKGADAFREQIAGARDFFDYQLDRMVAGPDFNTPRGKMQAVRKMAEFISLIRDSVLRETVMNRVTQRLEISAQEFVRLLKAPPSKTPDPLSTVTATAPPDPFAEDSTIRLLATVALRDAAAREWLLAEPWDSVLRDQLDAELLVKILRADIQPDDDASVHVFMTTLSATEEAAISGLLEEKMLAHPMTIVHDCWRELERRKIRHRVEATQARLRTPDLPDTERAEMLKEILDLQKRLLDISRPLSPPL
ncbi:DNA primase [Chthoniobacter flavus Ellin428]|uniref:DNA primase n=1 Tax=Chthoniobacter flavus Ellin428 TaxID=497964 RepID=B4CWV5_9BACT|nr:DNA primase [Chthoniobacter flavus]EDY21275.1 DNA primase [Chthoniobacter flavus Ellin428]TCO87642.1 DNA primase [Chthoniobacter flavus]